MATPGTERLPRTRITAAAATFARRAGEWLISITCTRTRSNRKSTDYENREGIGTTNEILRRARQDYRDRHAGRGLGEHCRSRSDPRTDVRFFSRRDDLDSARRDDQVLGRRPRVFRWHGSLRHI